MNPWIWLTPPFWYWARNSKLGLSPSKRNVFHLEQGGKKVSGIPEKLNRLRAAEREIMTNVNREDMNRLHSSEAVFWSCTLALFSGALELVILVMSDMPPDVLFWSVVNLPWKIAGNFNSFCNHWWFVSVSERKMQKYFHFKQMLSLATFLLTAKMHWFRARTSHVYRILLSFKNHSFLSMSEDNILMKCKKKLISGS